MVKTQSATISDLAKRWTLVQVPLGAWTAARGGSICCVLCGIVQPGLSTFYVDFHRCNNPRTGGSRRFNAHPRRGWLGDWTGWQISPPPLAWWAQVIFRHVPQNGLIFVRFSGDRQTKARIIVDTGLCSQLSQTDKIRRWPACQGSSLDNWRWRRWLWWWIWRETIWRDQFL